MKPIVFMLSGQGSQYYQMGLDFYSENEHFKNKMISFDNEIKDRFNFSLIDTIYDPKKSGSTVFCEPLLSSLSIYLIEYTLATTLIDYGVKPDKIIGSSMGMFAAGVLADSFNKYKGLNAIYYLMHQIKEKCPPGCMIAVLSDSQLYYDSKVMQEFCELASIDKGFSFVLSLQLHNLHHVESYLNEIGVNYQRLPVSRAYHSSWIDDIKDSFLDINLTSNKPKTPLFCSSKTEEISSLNSSDLWYAVRNPLLLSKTIEKIEQHTPHKYIDIGPSGMMATCLKYILPKNSESETYTILSPYKQASKNFNETIKHCKSY